MLLNLISEEPYFLIADEFDQILVAGRITLFFKSYILSICFILLIPLSRIIFLVFILRLVRAYEYLPQHLANLGLLNFWMALR